MKRRFQAKPVEVVGIKWTGDNFAEIQHFTNNLAYFYKGTLFICTTEGDSRCYIGDTVMRGTQGEFYPIKPHVLEAKYEEIND